MPINEDMRMTEHDARRAVQEPHVSFRHVQKSYDGETLIVSDLNLDIQRGEFLTLLGPSGSGKTTCLMMLAGFETPTAGEIRLGDEVINVLPPHKRNIGMVFQNYALFPHMTVIDNLRFPLKVRKLPASEVDTKAQRALDMVQLGAFGGRYPQQLSGGQQQRVALARALVFEPQLVLMDEPLGALDKNLREQMQIEIKHIQQDLGVTVVFVTHDQSEALTMSDRIAVFDKGVIQQLDSAEQLYERPENSCVANFIGENNALGGVVTAIDGEQCDVTLDCGTVIRASTGKVATGERTLLSVRPERVVLNGEAAACGNCLDAQVEEFIYLGDQVRIRVALCGNSNFTIKTPISRVDHLMRRGDSIRVGLDPAHIRALDPMPAA